MNKVQNSLMRLSTSKFHKRLSAAAACTALALTLAACSSDSDEGTGEDSEAESLAEDLDDAVPTEDGDDEDGDAEDSDDESDEDSEESDEDSDDDEPLVTPTKNVSAGTVAPGASATANAKKSAVVKYKQSDSFAVVADFECKKCKGDVSIRQRGSDHPLGSGKDSLSGRYLLDVEEGSDKEQSLIVDADGSWDLKLFSWNDLAVESGKQEGKGSNVLYIGDDASKVKVSYKPPKKGGEIDVNIISAVQEDDGVPKTVTVSGTKKLSETKKIKLPGIIEIKGKGSWTVDPIE